MILNNENGLLLMRHDNLGERSWRNDECYKLIFSPFGKGVYQTNSGDISIETGEFFIFNPNDLHKQLMATKEKFLVEINPTLLQNVALQLSMEQIEPEFALLTYKQPQIRQWVSFVRDFLLIHKESDLVINELFLDNSITQLAILMLQYGAGSHQNEIPSINGILYKPITSFTILKRCKKDVCSYLANKINNMLSECQKVDVFNADDPYPENLH